MTGIQTNFTAADMLGGTKAAKTSAPAPKKPLFFSAPAPVAAPEPVVEEVEEEIVEDVISEDEE
jgi:hypothetical protein